MNDLSARTVSLYPNLLLLTQWLLVIFWNATQEGSLSNRAWLAGKEG